MRLLILAFIALATLAGCGGGKEVWATKEAVERVAYRAEGPPRLTLFTMINNNTGAGAHTSLMINGSQRVIWDPAGSFHHETIPERNDLLYGITPQVADVYTRYHARKTYRVRIQTLDVSPELAERAITLAREAGPVGQAQCALVTSKIMAQLFPGKISSGWFPNKLADQFARIPGVSEQVLHEYDSDDNSKVLAQWTPERG
ncbi:hypothetical protein D6850_00220 [Roseovarius spongiae]|uniref:Lipoprotein n=1 Tax=Roseovarius spongiae TaxID=2320272 RepID=A0A3A8AUY2_9RHOB|nr:hypothetical protein [Roseovarius spongiae]RKF16038.1 hypothetical protein D6850_00220 [Roseovarius spongiae]